MLSAFEPNVKATIAFLQQLRVKVNASTVNETLQNHPDWPSLLSISDVLHKWDVPNGAGKTAPANIDELPLPFIAVTNNRKTPLAVVTAVNDNHVLSLYDNYQTAIKENRHDFIKRWNGIYLIAEPNSLAGERDYEKIKRKETAAALFRIVMPVMVAFAATFVFLANIQTGFAQNRFPATGAFLQYFITLAGLLVSALLLWYEMDKNNPLLHKVCTGITNGSCTAVLTHKASKVFSWLSWSELGFFYYAGALLCIIFAGEHLRPYLSLIALFNVLAIPYPVFSVYYQWRVVKQWCVLCLAVQALLIAGVINVLANQLHGAMHEITLPVLAQSFLLYVLPLLVWFTIKPIILKLPEAKHLKRDYLRIKFNPQIFDTLLRKQKQVNIPADSLGIDLGNPAAKNTLIKVCNPYCGPCAQAHPEIEKLLDEIPDLKVKIIFNATNSDADIRSKPAKHLLAISAMNDPHATRRALDEWYLADKKDYKTFAGKYPVNGLLQQQDKQIETMRRWCDEMNIEYTPTFFLNGYQLPGTYSIADLKYFLLEAL